MGNNRPILEGGAVGKTELHQSAEVERGKSFTEARKSNALKTVKSFLTLLKYKAPAIRDFYWPMDL